MNIMPAWTPICSHINTVCPCHHCHWYNYYCWYASANMYLKITRLNSVIFRIFDPREWNLNQESSDCRPSKIIFYDTLLELISWVLNVENQLFNFCVGVGFDGHDAINFSHISNDVQENAISFDTNLMAAVGRRKNI